MDKSRAQEIFNRMNENEKYGCRFGLFPMWVARDYKPTKAETIELMGLAEKGKA